MSEERSTWRALNRIAHWYRAFPLWRGYALLPGDDKENVVPFLYRMNAWDIQT
jgi:hypothetical protein